MTGHQDNKGATRRYFQLVKIDLPTRNVIVLGAPESKDFLSEMKRAARQYNVRETVTHGRYGGTRLEVRTAKFG